MNNLFDIGSRLKFARELCEYTQQQIADKTGVPQANYARYETGVTKKIPHSFLHKVVNVLYVDFKWLLTGEVKKAHSEALNAIYVLWKERAENLPEKVGVPQEYIDAIRNNEISPSETLIKKIENATGFALDVPEKKVENEQCKDNGYLKKENEDLKKERDWLRKQNEDLLQIVKSLRKD